MCIIAYGLKKNLKRDEIEQCMKTNPSGFFIGVLKRDPKDNVFLRTLDERDVMDAFDAASDDDRIVTHSRIPSRGGHTKNIEDVHGWDEDGVRFCHNMTLSSLDDFMEEDNWTNTDSEYFFRRMFMPLYRACGNRVTDELDKVVRLVCGQTNKFLFVFPDNSVRMYGNWMSDHDCKFSNSTYVIPKRPEAKPNSFTLGDEDDYDYDYDYCGGYGYGGRGGYSSYAAYGKTKRADEDPDTVLDGSRAVKLLGYPELARLCCLAFVLSNVADNETDEAVRMAYLSTLPEDMCDRLMSSATDIIAQCDGKDPIDKVMAPFAAELEKACFKGYLATKWTLESMEKRISEFPKTLAAAAYAMNVHYDFTVTDPADAVSSWRMAKSKKGRPIMTVRKDTEMFLPPGYEYDDCAMFMFGLDAMVGLAIGADAEAKAASQRKEEVKA